MYQPFGEERLDATWKGFPPGTGPLTLAEIAAEGWSLLRGELPLPVAILRDSALRHNSSWMRRFVAARGALLCPHGKTTMAPALFRRQLDDGAWGITVATVQQLAVPRAAGVRRILLANEVVDPPAIRSLFAALAEDPGLEILCLVDSLEGVARLAAAGAGAPRPLAVLLEAGMKGGRAGVRSLPDGLDVARAAAAAPCLRLRGVEGFEGIVTGSDEERRARVDAFVDFLGELAEAVAREGRFAPGEVLVSAGGSAFYDRVAARFSGMNVAGARLVLRSGCYLTHDDGVYAGAQATLLARSPEARAAGEEGLRPALEVWAAVTSRPEPARSICGLGQRDVGRDAGLPVPRWWYRPSAHDCPIAMPAGHAAVTVNDQHTWLDTPAGSPLAVGDLVGFGVSHPCTTFDKWRLLYVVDDDYRVVEGVRTVF